MSILSRMRADLRDFALYTAGDGDDTRIRLHANESPYRAADDRSARGRHRYPLGRHGALHERLAGLYGVDSGQVLATRGSDDGIDLLIRTFCTAGRDNILCTTPGFGMYRGLARLQGCDSVEFPLRAAADFALEMNAYTDAANANTKLVFVCSPNNPSGIAVGLDDIALACRQLAGQALIVVDEAYGEFSATPSATTLIAHHDNLVVLRTLSKAYGLAAARVGTVIGNADIIQVLDQLLTPFPLPSTSVDQAMLATAPERQARMQDQWQQLIDARETLRGALEALPCIQRVWPSDANFLLTRSPHSAALVAHCHEQGLLVRLIQGIEETFVRITIGSAQQNTQLLEALESFRP